MGTDNEIIGYISLLLSSLIMGIFIGSSVVTMIKSRYIKISLDMFQKTMGSRLAINPTFDCDGSVREVSQRYKTKLISAFQQTAFSTSKSLFYTSISITSLDGALLGTRSQTNQAKNISVKNLISRSVNKRCCRCIISVCN